MNVKLGMLATEHLSCHKLTCLSRSSKFMGSKEGVGSSEKSSSTPTASSPDASEVSAVDAETAPSSWNVITLRSSSSASGVDFDLLSRFGLTSASAAAAASACSCWASASAAAASSSSSSTITSSIICNHSE